METYIRRYDGVLGPKTCDRLIKRFEDNPDQYEKHKQGEMSFTQINLLKHKEWTDDTNIIGNVLMEQVEQYKKDCNIVGADIVELAPHYDQSGVSTAVAAKLVREMLLLF